MIFGLSNAVVSLKGVGLVQCGVYDDGFVYCSDARSREWFGYVVDLTTGIIQPAAEEDRSYCDNLFVTTDGKLPKFAEQIRSDSFSYSYRFQCFTGKYVWLTQLILALTSHQVSGDQILKGLRAKGVRLSVSKLSENYLGGWIITKDDHYISVSEMIDALFTK